jgi:hypothetical protein
MGHENSWAVALGTHVEVELVDESGASEYLAFDLVPDERADFANGFLGVGTPLAQAILGKVAGESGVRLGDRSVCIGVTEAVRVREDVAAKRQAVIQQAVAESSASAWCRWRWARGGYDPGDARVGAASIRR